MCNHLCNTLRGGKDALRREPSIVLRNSVNVTGSALSDWNEISWKSAMIRIAERVCDGMVSGSKQQLRYFA
jgi:hypothetical protein